MLLGRGASSELGGPLGMEDGARLVSLVLLQVLHHLMLVGGGRWVLDGAAHVLLLRLDLIACEGARSGSCMDESARGTRLDGVACTLPYGMLFGVSTEPSLHSICLALEIPLHGSRISSCLRSAD